EAQAAHSQRRYLKMARESASLLSRLTDNLLAVHQMESRHLELHKAPTSIGDVWIDAHTALAGLAALQEVELASFLRSGDFPLQADADLIRRVLLNLAANALKHTPAHGRIEVSARMVVRRSDGEEMPAAGQEGASDGSVTRWV